jgi:hypothetical protein
VKPDGKVELKSDMLVEVLTTGQSVLPPTIHPDTKKPYTWLSPRTLFDTPIGELVEITPEAIAALEAALAPWLPERHHWVDPAASTPVNPGRMAAYARAALVNTTQTLSAMAPNSGRNNALFNAACSLGKFVHHNIIGLGDLEGRLLSASKANGLMQERGVASCTETIRNGLKRATNDELPALQPLSS